MVDNAISNAYSQSGGDLAYFAGKQYGGGWLRTLARFAFPILKRVVGVATIKTGKLLPWIMLDVKLDRL